MATVEISEQELERAVELERFAWMVALCWSRMMGRAAKEQVPHYLARELDKLTGFLGDA